MRGAFLMLRGSLAGCALLLLGCPERNPSGVLDAATDVAVFEVSDATEEATADVLDDTSVTPEDAACAAGRTRCGDACVDLSADAMNCGACGAACGPGFNALRSCRAGACRVLSCVRTALDCDSDPSNGCEYIGMPPDVTECRSDYSSGACVGPALVGCGVLPLSCEAGSGVMARVYTVQYQGHTLTFPRPARRVQMTFGATSGAGCHLFLLDERGAPINASSVATWCDPGARHLPAANIDYLAGAGAPSAGGVLIQHVSRSNCYVSDLVLTY